MALNTNLTTTSSISATAAKTYYQRKLLKEAKPKLVHTQYGQKTGLPQNEGTIVSFRKWTPFPAITTALTEGTVPDGQALTMTEVTATIAEYGGYVAISKKLSITAIDKTTIAAVEQMGDQGGLSIDTITRNVIHAGTNVLRPTTYRHQLAATDVLTTVLLRKAVRALKKAKARPFSRNGRDYFVAIVSPDSYYDLQSDSTWVAVAEYQDKESIFSGEIGRLFGVIIVETTEAKVFTAANLTEDAADLTCASYVTATKVMTVKEAISAAEATALVGRKILITNTDTGATAELDTIASSASGAAGAATITLTTGLAATNTKYADQVVYRGEAGKAAIDVQSTVVFGQDAYGVVDIEGGNMKTYVEEPGSAGTADPLHQISTVGWKVDGFVAVILQSAHLVRIETGATA